MPSVMPVPYLALARLQAETKMRVHGGSRGSMLSASTPSPSLPPSDMVALFEMGFRRISDAIRSRDTEIPLRILASMRQALASPALGSPLPPRPPPPLPPTATDLGDEHGTLVATPENDTDDTHGEPTPVPNAKRQKRLSVEDATAQLLASDKAHKDRAAEQKRRDATIHKKPAADVKKEGAAIITYSHEALRKQFLARYSGESSV